MRVGAKEAPFIDVLGRLVVGLQSAARRAAGPSTEQLPGGVVSTLFSACGQVSALTCRPGHRFQPVMGALITSFGGLARRDLNHDASRTLFDCEAANAGEGRRALVGAGADVEARAMYGAGDHVAGQASGAQGIFSVTAAVFDRVQRSAYATYQHLDVSSVKRPFFTLAQVGEGAEIYWFERQMPANPTVRRIPRMPSSDCRWRRTAR